MSPKSAKHRSSVFVASLICLIGMNQIVMAQEKNHAAWNVDAILINDNEAMINLQVRIDSGWHVYTADVPVPDAALQIFFDKSEKYQLVNAVRVESASIEKMDPIFGRPLKRFERYALFSQRIKITDTYSIVKGSIRFTVGSEDLRPRQQILSFSVGVIKANKNTARPITVSN